MRDQLNYVTAWNNFFNKNTDLFIDIAPDLKYEDYFNYFTKKHGSFLLIHSPVIFDISILNKYKENIFRYYSIIESTGLKHMFILQLDSKIHLICSVFYEMEDKRFVAAFSFNVLDAEEVNKFEENNKNYKLDLEDKEIKLGFGSRFATVKNL